MTKDEFLDLKKKHSHKNQYKVEDEDELKEMIKLAESIDMHMDLNWLDVSSIEDMSYLFKESKFNGDISKWNVSNVRNMCCMFESSEFNSDISNWDVSNVIDMDSMFANSKFNRDISKWNVRNVEDMSSMFRGSKFNGDISKWDVSKVGNAIAFNPYLGINNKKDLKDYISFLNSIYNNRPIKADIKKEWLKTEGLLSYVANRLSEDPKFVDKIKKLLCE